MFFFLLVQILPWLTLTTCDDIDISGATRRIIGGHLIRIEEAPYMALYRPVNKSFHCGASVVSDQFLVTAAHCVDKSIHGEMIVTVGTDRALSGGENYQIEEVVKHPQYEDGIFFDYDIAVIKLKNKLQFSDRVQPIKMAEPGLVIDDTAQLRTIGFGMTETNYNSNELLGTDMRYIPNNICRVVTQDSIITDRMLCAGQKNKSVCYGDSGGPAVYGDKLVGVTSGSDIPICNSYSLFARVSSLRGFIDDVIAAH
ncbi:trypsin-7-like [Bicyclus anynana]|uniref:trypsin n=1 Tax=Bicyclus anynana TaxID=110368 RepID=A0A6J1MYL8_BICAN|nr:trypsin-7-like [Bicyclus anynana]